MDYPQIILLNGTSSSGKTTLCHALKEKLKVPYFYYSSDQLVDSGMLPKVDREVDNTQWSWNKIRPSFFDGFHKSIDAFASTGIYLIIEHVIEYSNWFKYLISLLHNYNVLYVGVMCPIEEIEKREIARGNRQMGEGKSHLEDGIHSWSTYDITVDTFLKSPEENAVLLINYIEKTKNAEKIFHKIYKETR